MDWNPEIRSVGLYLFSSQALKREIGEKLHLASTAAGDVICRHKQLANVTAPPSLIVFLSRAPRVFFN
jgi:hypothetical protein